MLEQDAIEHGEDGLLLGLGEAGEALELALELGGGTALVGVRAGDAEQHIGQDGEERGEPGHEGDGEAEPADLVVRVNNGLEDQTGDDRRVGDHAVSVGRPATALAK